MDRMLHVCRLALRTVCTTMLLLAAVAIGTAAQAGVFEPRSFDSPADRERYLKLIEELRCLVCQNQNLADSNADLAADLRDRVYAMIRDGKSDHAIVDFMVARYGDFVLYRPPLRARTALLWGGPFLILAIAVGVLLARVRRARRSATASSPLTDEQRHRAARLLGEDGRS